MRRLNFLNILFYRFCSRSDSTDRLSSEDELELAWFFSCYRRALAYSLRLSLSRWLYIFLSRVSLLKVSSLDSGILGCYVIWKKAAALLCFSKLLLARWWCDRLASVFKLLSRSYIFASIFWLSLSSNDCSTEYCLRSSFKRTLTLTDFCLANWTFFLLFCFG